MTRELAVTGLRAIASQQGLPEDVKAKLEEYEKLRKEKEEASGGLEKVLAAKLDLLREAFRAVGDATLAAADYQTWLHDNEAWVSVVKANTASTDG